MQNSFTKIDDLRTLLEDLYPDVRISRRGVALLAAQIGELEDKCELIRNRIDVPGAASDLTTMETPVLWPPTLYWGTNYGTNNHTK